MSASATQGGHNNSQKRIENDAIVKTKATEC